MRPVSVVLFLGLLLLLLLLACDAAAQESIEVGLGNVRGSLLAIGDMNNDRFTDLFTLSTDRQDVVLFLWDQEGDLFRMMEAATIRKTNKSVIGAIPADFNDDGKLDLLLMYQDSSQAQNPQLTQTTLEIFFGDHQKFTGSSVINGTTMGQVSIADVNGDLQPDLVGVTAASPQQRTLWVNRGDGTFNRITGSNEYFLSEGTTDEFAATGYRFSIPSSHAFVDLDGDCRSDLVFTVEDPCTPGANCLHGPPQYMEIWLNSRGRFTFHSRKPLPEGTQQLTFADFDSDGNADILIPVCWPSNDCSTRNGFMVLINQQITVCGSSGASNAGSGCRSTSNLCSSSSFSFEDATSWESSEYRLWVEIPAEEALIARDFSIPVAIRAGDFNLDGFPDVMFSTKLGTSTFHTWLLYNEVCSSSSADAACLRRGRSMSFSMRKTLLSDSSVLGAFVDMGERGQVDVLLQHDLGSLEAKRNYDVDAFFFKIFVTSGKCPSWCSSEPKFPSPKPLTPMYGATVRFLIRDLDGRINVHATSILTQASYSALELPYGQFGVGRTNNYVEYLEAGIPSRFSSNVLRMTNIIPNAQLVIYPYPADDPSRWLAELYVAPGGYLLWVGIAVLCTVVALGIPVIILDRMEKIADEKEKKANAHFFSLDAL